MPSSPLPATECRRHALQPPAADDTRPASPPSDGWVQWWSPRRDAGVDYELLWGAVLLVVFAAARLLPSRLLTWYPCPFHKVTGMPCPTCGTTRATLHAVHLEWGAAFSLNPLGTVGIALAWMYIGYAAVVTTLRLPRPRFSFRHRYAVLFFRVLLPLALLLNWGYLIHHGV